MLRDFKKHKIWKNPSWNEWVMSGWSLVLKLDEEVLNSSKHSKRVGLRVEKNLEFKFVIKIGFEITI